MVPKPTLLPVPGTELRSRAAEVIGGARGQMPPWVANSLLDLPKARVVTPVPTCRAAARLFGLSAGGRTQNGA